MSTSLGSFSPLSAFTAEIDDARADADRVLGDRARHQAGADLVLLFLAEVVADEHDLLAGFLDADRRAFRRAFVGAEDALEVRVRLEVRLGDFGRLQVIAAAVLDADDLDVGVLGLHLVEEAVAAVDAGPARLVVHDHGDFAGIADQFGHLVGGDRGGRHAIRVAGRQRDVAVDARVEGDDRDVGGLRLLQERNGGLAVERGEAQRLRLLGQRSRQHVDLLVDHRFGFRALEGDPDVVGFSRLFGAELHGLPELMLEALGDERDVDVVRACVGCKADRHEGAERHANVPIPQHRDSSTSVIVPVAVAASCSAGGGGSLAAGSPFQPHSSMPQARFRRRMSA